ncbi:MAG: hypothetical protein JWO26_1698 [Rhodospirillales bacterium]|nr:hypothetical protein [Rhodospirillales bacterium]
MAATLRHIRGACLSLMLCAGLLAPQPSVAQDGASEYAERASATFGMVCLFLPTDDLDDGALVLGLTAICDPDLIARMMPGGPARAWSTLMAGRVMLLARRDEDGACLMDVVGADDGLLFSAIDRMMRRLHGHPYQIVEQEVPRGLPRPSLRARYQLTTQDGAAYLVSCIVEVQPGVGPRLNVVLRPE